MKLLKCPFCHTSSILYEKDGEMSVKRFCLPCSENYKNMVIKKPVKPQKNFYVRPTIKYKNIRHYVNNIDLEALNKNMINIRSWRGYFSKTGLPDITIRRSNKKTYTTGAAWPTENRYCITLSKNCDIANVESIMLHELAHLVDDSPAHHSKSWKDIYNEAVYSRYNIKLDYDNMDSFDMTDAVEKSIRLLISNP